MHGEVVSNLPVIKSATRRRYCSNRTWKEFWVLEGVDGRHPELRFFPQAFLLSATTRPQPGHNLEQCPCLYRSHHRLAELPASYYTGSKVLWSAFGVQAFHLQESDSVSISASSIFLIFVLRTMLTCKSVYPSSFDVSGHSGDFLLAQRLDVRTESPSLACNRGKWLERMPTKWVTMPPCVCVH